MSWFGNGSFGFVCCLGPRSGDVCFLYSYSFQQLDLFLPSALFSYRCLRFEEIWSTFTAFCSFVLLRSLIFAQTLHSLGLVKGFCEDGRSPGGCSGDFYRRTLQFESTLLSVRCRKYSLWKLIAIILEIVLLSPEMVTSRGLTAAALTRSPSRVSLFTTTAARGSANTRGITFTRRPFKDQAVCVSHSALQDSGRYR